MKLTSYLSKGLCGIFLLALVGTASHTRGSSITNSLEDAVYNDIKAGDFKRAIVDATQAINSQPQSATLFILRGYSRAELNDQSGAITDYLETIRLDPKYPNVYIDLAAARNGAGDYNDAISDYTTAIGLNPKDSNAYDCRGYSEGMYLNDYSRAMADFADAIRINPSNAWVYSSLGSVKLYFNEDLSNAATDFGESVELDPTNALFYFNRGAFRQVLYDYHGAVDDFNKAIKLRPSLFQPYYRLGLVQSVEGELRLALTNFNHAADLIQLPLIGNRVYLVRLQLGERNALNREFADISTDPGYTNYVAAIRRRHFAVGTYVAIQPFLEGALSEDDLLRTATNSVGNSKIQREQLCEAYFYIGMRRLINGDKKGAVESFRECFTIGPLRYGEDNYDEYWSAEAEFRALTLGANSKMD